MLFCKKMMMILLNDLIERDLFKNNSNFMKSNGILFPGIGNVTDLLPFSYS